MLVRRFSAIVAIGLAIALLPMAIMPALVRANDQATELRASSSADDARNQIQFQSPVLPSAGRQPPEAPSAEAQPPDAPSADAPSADAPSADASLTAADAAKSRYRRFNGRWWYWLPSKQWALWDGNQWTIPSPKPNGYQEWRHQQFAGRYHESASQDEARRRRDVDFWRGRLTGQSLATVGRADTDYHSRIDRLHDTLMITPYDYRIGTAGHGLFDANPDRVIGNSGRLNYATSVGGYMGGALRSPYGY